MLWLVSFTFSKRRRWQISEKHVYLYFGPHTIFSSIFLHAVTFSHVLHLDVVRSQIELKLKVKSEISLCTAIMQNNPLPSLYTVPYIHYSAGADELAIVHRNRFST